MYPRNAASPERIAIGAVILIADGTVQTAGVAVKVVPFGATESTGGGTVAYSADGVVLYTPTQAETNYTSIVFIASKSACIPASATVVTSAVGVAGQSYVGVVATDAITAAAIAADAVTEIQNGLATPTNITAATGIVLSGVTHTGAIIPTVTLVDTTTTNTDMRGTDGANTTAPSTPANVSAVTTTLAALLPAALVGGRIDASVGAVATDAINAAAIAADAVTEIQDGLATQTSLDAKLTAARLGALTSLDAMIVANVYTTDSMANVSLAAGGDATAANQDLLLARLATGPIRITSTVTAGGVVNLRVGDDYVGTRIAITFDDAGGTIMTYMQSASVASVIFGAGRNTEINEIYGTVDPDDGVYDSGAGTSTVYPQIARADITGPVSDDYAYQIKAIDTAGRHITKIAGSVVVLAKNAFPV